MKSQENHNTKEKIEKILDKNTLVQLIKLKNIQQRLYEEHIKNNKLNERTEKYNLEENNSQVNRVNNPHDKIARIILSNKKEAANLINRQLKLKGRTRVKAEEIEEIKNIFITTDYYNRAADIVYKSLKYDGIYFLIEHQTKIDYTMPKRVAEYQIEIMRNALKEYKNNNIKQRIPTIFVIIVYNGEQEWNVSRYLKDSQAKFPGIETEALGTYSVMDASRYTDEELLEQEGILPKILACERTRDIEKLKLNCEKIMEGNSNEEEIEEFNRYVYTILGNKFGQDRVKGILEKINNRKEKTTMIEDVIDKAIDDGIAKGKKQWIERGILKNRRAMIQRMLKNNLDDELIKAISGVEDKELAKIKAKMA